MDGGGQLQESTLATKVDFEPTGEQSSGPRATTLGCFNAE